MATRVREVEFSKVAVIKFGQAFPENTDCLRGALIRRLAYEKAEPISCKNRLFFNYEFKGTLFRVFFIENFQEGAASKIIVVDIALVNPIPTVV